MDKYTWVDFGSSYLPSELNAAYLWAQLLVADLINEDRLRCWNYYHEALRPLQDQGLIERPVIPKGCMHNAHMYYIKCKDLDERTRFITYMKSRGIQCVFHYIPLHSSPAGKRFGRFYGEDRYTTRESERLVRLPMYYQLPEESLACIVEAIRDFYQGPSL